MSLLLPELPPVGAWVRLLAPASPSTAVHVAYAGTIGRVTAHGCSAETPPRPTVYVEAPELPVDMDGHTHGRWWDAAEVEGSEPSPAEQERRRRGLPGEGTAENGPVTVADRALILATVGDVTEPKIPTRASTECPECEGRGQVDKAGKPVPMSTMLRALFHPKCSRCSGEGKLRGADSLLTLDELTRKWCAARSFEEWVFDPGGVRRYRPSLGTVGRPECGALADAYDAVQVARGDARRVSRY